MSQPHAARTKPWWALEDWVVVWLGFTALAAIAAGYRPVSLAFKWAALADLNNLFTGAVLSGWLAVAAPALLLGAVGVALLRDPVIAFASAFPIVCSHSSRRSAAATPPPTPGALSSSSSPSPPACWSATPSARRNG
jgi:hypothetical protein